MIEILLATTNPHKLGEVRAVLEPHAIRVLSLNDVLGPAGEAALEEPVEDAPTFEGNARIKATHYATHTGRVTLADDSGLEVDALDGAPGVLSARYAGVGADRAARDAANNAKLLDALADVPDDRRTARFVCAMCLAAPDGRILATSRGTFEGRIAHGAQGNNGFGYDPLLIVAGDPTGRTSAELSPDEKNARSHRGAAARAIAPRIVEATGAGEDDAHHQRRGNPSKLGGLS